MAKKPAQNKKAKQADEEPAKLVVSASAPAAISD